MRLNTHLSFDGRCQAAFEYYEKHLGGKITMAMKYADSDKILHATLSLGDDRLTGADVLPEQYEKPRGFSVLLSLDDPAEADRIFTALSENGAVQLPMQETFWALRFGMLVDQFGVPWMINCEKSGTVQNPR